MRRWIKAIDILLITFFNYFLGIPLPISFLIGVFLFIGIYSFRSYDIENMDSATDSFVRVITGTMLGFILILILYTILFDNVMNRFHFLYNFIFAISVIPLLHKVEFKILENSLKPKKYLVIGRKNEIGHILDEITNKSLGKLQFVEFINPSPQKLHKLVENDLYDESLALENLKKDIENFIQGKYVIAEEDNNLKGFSRLNDFFDLKSKNKSKDLDAIIVTDPALEEMVKPQLDEYKRHGIKVDYLPNISEKYLKRIPVEVLERFKDYYEVIFENIEDSPAKRIVDIFISSIALIILSPIMFMISICILIEDGKPVIFKQERVGIDESTFTMNKFRSMRNEKNKKSKFATDEQHRILKIGKLIRPVRLDETLQFWDILRSTMSFVGPRPEQVKFVEYFNHHIPFYYARHKVKCGLTGWAQIMYGYSASIEETKIKLSYDLYYVKNRTTIMDFQIILKTLEAIFWKRGAV